MFPRYQPYLIKDMASQLLIDGNIVSGGLEAYRQDSVAHVIDKLYKGMYRYLRSDGRKQWLLFDSDVDVVRSATIDDSQNQMFATIDGELRTFDTQTLPASDSTLTKDNSYKASISVPETPTLVQVSGNAGSKSTRAYLIAYARNWRSGKLDLGPASLPAKTSGGLTYVEVDTTHTAQLSNIKPNPNEDEHTDTIYVYRAVVTSSGEGTWRQVISFGSTPGSVIPTGVTYDQATKTYTFTDNIKDEDLGEVATGIDWGCPEKLEGIISVGNGVLAAFHDNTVYLSEPYQGHAWPASYAIPTDFKIVGLGSFGNTLVVCTIGNTYMCVVSDPSMPILRPIQEAQACVSKNSIVSMTDSVIYATNYGLIRITSNGADRITYPIITEKEWQYYNPSSITAAHFQGKYLFFFDSDIVEYNGAIIDFNEINLGIMGLSQEVSCMWQDDASSEVFIQYISPVLLQPRIFSFANNSSLKRLYRWRSKKFINQEGLINLSAGKINFYDDRYQIKDTDFTHKAETYSHTFNGPLVNTFAINGDASTSDYWFNKLNKQWCKLDFYIDDRIFKTVNVYNNFPFRLPVGYRGDSYFVDIISTVPISRVQLASSIGELE